MPTPHHDSGGKAKSSRQNVRKKRTAVSCDRCKSRKTKVTSSDEPTTTAVPGPCHYCASINAPCKTDLNRRKKRPYYHVSEEEYRCMTTILRHYLPDLEFSLPALKALCQRLEGLEDESGRPTPVPTPTPTATTAHDEDVFGSEDRGAARNGGDGGGRQGLEDDGGRCGDGVDGEGDGGEEEESDPSMREIQALQERLGCLMIDSRGNYSKSHSSPSIHSPRHVGTDSSIGFNAAIRMIKGADRCDQSPDGSNPPGPRSDDDDDDDDDGGGGGGGGPDVIIQPLATTSLPPATPESSVGGGGSSVDSYCSGSSQQQQPQQVFLPPLEHASASVQRYFDEVHCLYWLFSTEQFHERVHETYMTGGVFAGASWLCCLYSIFAIGSAGDDRVEEVVAGPERKTKKMMKKKSSAEYLVLAKALVPQVIDEADVDSVRALSLLALALQTECYTNAAYLYVGTAVRTAYTLGLHVERAAPPTRGRLEREQNRRIWWTLYVLDYEMAHRYGNPCAVVDDGPGEEVQDDVWRVQMPSEQYQQKGREKWTQLILEAVQIMRGMEQVGWTARALPELSAQLRECGILDGGGEDCGGDGELAPPLGMEEMMRDAMMGQRDDAGEGGGFATGGGVEGMEVDDAFFLVGDGGVGGFGDTYNSALFLGMDFTDGRC
ncbi:hypothetical protein SLS58_001668 [Diplodia intermedia]|uniref:Xylanolytic transcriptional activator regulatory domain-containing protein n=1 Tax=Diplodia intermedia TaxID=856260 RepID=A0ABR3U2K3_9PEZI